MRYQNKLQIIWNWGCWNDCVVIVLLLYYYYYKRLTCSQYEVPEHVSSTDNPKKEKYIITVHIMCAQKLLTQQHLSEQNSLEHFFKGCKADSRFHEVGWKGVPWGGAGDGERPRAKRRSEDIVECKVHPPLRTEVSIDPEWLRPGRSVLYCESKMAAADLYIPIL